MNDAASDMQDFHKLQPDRKLAVIGIMIFVFVFAILVSIYVSKSGGLTQLTQRVTNPTSQTEQKADATTLSMTSDVTSLSVGNSATVTVNIANNPVQAVDIAVNFDPNMFTASNIVNGTVYADILRSEITDGQVVVSATVSPSDPTDLKTGDVFSFTLEALSAGSGELTFDPELTITAKNGVNTLGTAEGITLTVTQ